MLNCTLAEPKGRLVVTNATNLGCLAVNARQLLFLNRSNLEVVARIRFSGVVQGMTAKTGS